MANTINTEGIVGVVPTNTDSGPDYATLITNYLANNVAPHTHDGVLKGNLINIAGQTISDDLALDGYNLSNVRSVQFLSQPSVLSGSQDVNSVYVNQNNLGFNNSNGIFVPITNGNSLAVTTLPFTNFSVRNVSSNFTILNTDTYNLIDINTTGGAITGTLPIAATIAPQSVGRLFIFRDISYTAHTHNVTIQVAPASGNTFAQDGSTNMIINNDGGYIGLYTDGVSKWFTWTQNVYSDEMLSFQNSTLNNTGTFVNYDGSCQIGNSGLFVQAGGLFGWTANATVVIRSGTSVTVEDTGTNWTWQNLTNETHANGATDTFQAGSNVIFNGNVNGTTSGGTLTFGSTLNLNANTNNNGTFNLPGITNFNGNGTFSGSANQITGSLQVVGAGNINVHGSGSIFGDKSAIYQNVGKSTIGGDIATTVVLASPGTYNVDSGPQYDRVISCILSNSAAFVINMPASPDVGRMITFGNANDASPFSGYSMTANGNGHNFVTVGSATSTKFISTTGTGVASITFMFVNNTWVAISAYNTT